LPTRSEDIVAMDVLPIIERKSTVVVGLPDFKKGFARIISKVRESSEGIKLRQSMRRLGEDINFDEQNDRWRAVADIIGRELTPHANIKISSVVARLGKHFIYGTLAGGLYAASRRGHVPTLPRDLVDLGIEAALGGVLAAGGDLIIEMLRTDVEHQRIRSELERAVVFRCAEVPIFSLPQRASET